MIPVILAHSGLGILDEIFFIGIALIFTAFLIFGWYKSRNFEPEWKETSNETEAKES